MRYLYFYSSVIADMNIKNCTNLLSYWLRVEFCADFDYAVAASRPPTAGVQHSPIIAVIDKASAALIGTRRCRPQFYNRHRASIFVLRHSPLKQCHFCSLKKCFNINISKSHTPSWIPLTCKWINSEAFPSECKCLLLIKVSVDEDIARGAIVQRIMTSHIIELTSICIASEFRPESPSFQKCLMMKISHNCFAVTSAWNAKRFLTR